MSLHSKQNGQFVIHTPPFFTLYYSMLGVEGPVISNYPLDELYKAERDKGKTPSYKGFLRRFKEIIRFDGWYSCIWEKGEPTEEIKQAIEEQGGKWSVKPDPRYADKEKPEQTKIEEVF